MSTLIVALLSFVGFIVAYNTYGRWLGKRIFQLDPNADVPSEEMRDDVDFVPTRRSIVFGHHFTSIAGTGPIVGPAIAVFWGWLPALLWVLIGSIFIGAVHDFGALVISLRNRGQTVGEIAGRVISKRARLLFLLILFFALTIVLAIFGLVVAKIFANYPGSVLAVWASLPLAIFIGAWSRRKNAHLLVPSLVALSLVYLAVYVGVYYLPLRMPAFSETFNPVVVWTLILLVYCFFASVLPVWFLLQPRDYINSHQLMVALGLLILGLLVAGMTGSAELTTSAPAIAKAPSDAPPIFPFLFITIACGAVSGFHCLVSSGTSSKQIACEPDARAVGYGAMLLEGGLAVVVILACCAGIGMGKFARSETDSGVAWLPMTSETTGVPLVGQEAWKHHYGDSWKDFNKLDSMVGAFVEGGANFLASLGIPLELGVGLIAVLVACFAATTLDTATRLQRYVVQELGETLHIKPLTNKYLATAFAIGLAGSLAMMRGNPDLPLGTGGTILWPLFGATNQLLAGLACMVVVLYLWRRGKPIWFAAIPMVIMIILPGWALLWLMFNPDSGFLSEQKYLLLGVGFLVFCLQIWMIIEGMLIWKKAHGVLEEPLPPLPGKPAVEGGRSC